VGLGQRPNQRPACQGLFPASPLAQASRDCVMLGPLAARPGQGSTATDDCPSTAFSRRAPSAPVGHPRGGPLRGHLATNGPYFGTHTVPGTRIRSARNHTTDTNPGGLRSPVASVRSQRAQLREKCTRCYIHCSQHARTRIRRVLPRSWTADPPGSSTLDRHELRIRSTTNLNPDPRGKADPTEFQRLRCRTCFTTTPAALSTGNTQPQQPASTECVSRNRSPNGPLSTARTSGPPTERRRKSATPSRSEPLVRRPGPPNGAGRSSTAGRRDKSQSVQPHTGSDKDVG